MEPGARTGRGCQPSSMSEPSAGGPSGVGTILSERVRLIMVPSLIQPAQMSTGMPATKESLSGPGISPAYREP